MSAYTLMHGGAEFIHQHLVDAWAAQQAAPSKSNIALAFSLIGLYLAVEKGFTGRQVQLAHMQLGKTKRIWPWFDPPLEEPRFTILDVARAKAGPDRDAAIKEWAAAVWDTWTHAHDWTRRICAELLGVRA
jgi:Family of unknown function (DUF5946)